MTVSAEDRDPEKVCNSDGCSAWKMGDFEYCRNHKGVNRDGSSHENNANAVSHGLYQSEATFLENAPERHRDAYHAIHESLCSRWEVKHGGEIPTHAEKELSHVALDMVKLDMANEYERENAIDPEKPLTERQLKDVGGDPMEVEAVSKVESLKTDIRRENRLLLKDMGVYSSPEQQAANATKTLAEVLSED